LGDFLTGGNIYRGFFIRKQLFLLFIFGLF